MKRVCDKCPYSNTGAPDPLSDILLSFRCSLPTPFGILFAVRYVSLPKLLYVSGPNTKWEEVIRILRVLKTRLK